MEEGLPNAKVSLSPRVLVAMLGSVINCWLSMEDRDSINISDVVNRSRVRSTDMRMCLARKRGNNRSETSVSGKRECASDV